MKISKIMGKKAVVIAIAAAGVLSAGSASASIFDKVAAHKVAPSDLTGVNNTTGCVRFYVNPNYASDIKAGHRIWFGKVDGLHKFYASVFSGACGGKAIKTVSYTTAPGRTVTWNVN